MSILDNDNIDPDRGGKPTSSGTVAVPGQEEILAGVKQTLTVALPPEELAQVDVDAVTQDTFLLSLPLDSLALMELMTALEDKFRVFIPDDKAFAFERVSDLTGYIHERLEKKAERA